MFLLYRLLNYLYDSKDFFSILLTSPKVFALLYLFQLSLPWRCIIVEEGTWPVQAIVSGWTVLKEIAKEVSEGSCPLVGRMLTTNLKGPLLFCRDSLPSIEQWPPGGWGQGGKPLATVHHCPPSTYLILLHFAVSSHLPLPHHWSFFPSRGSPTSQPAHGLGIRDHPLTPSPCLTASTAAVGKLCSWHPEWNSECTPRRCVIFWWLALLYH